jgi:hypothetical protein
VSRLSVNPPPPFIRILPEFLTVPPTTNPEPYSTLIVPAFAPVYGRFRDPKDGTSRQENLDRWSDYARSNSYHRGPGPGKEPTMPDPRERSAGYRPGDGKGSDGQLASTKNWASYEYGGDSGLGRLEKSEKY